MNAIIFTEGGAEKGYGHITRCIAIYDALKELEVVTELVVNGTEEIGELLGDRSYIFHNWPSDFESIFSHLNHDLLIFDSYIADQDLYNKINSLVCGFCVYLDDDLRMDYPQGIVINPVNAAFKLEYKKNQDDLLLGYKYFPFRKELWGSAKNKHSELNSRVVLILGGSDLRELCIPIVKYLTEFYPNVYFDLVVTASYKNLAKIKNLSNKQISIYQNPSTDQLVSLMLKADVAITGAGQTMFELAALGIPMIAIGIIENQRYNIESLKDDDCILFAGYWDDPALFQNLKSCFERMAPKEFRETLSQISKDLVDSKGALSISKKLVNRIERNSLSIRKVRVEDAESLFKLANDKTVRKNSINQDKIEWQNHIQWLEAKIQDSRCYFFIVTNKSGTLAGQIRYEVSNETNAIVSISLSASFRGKGFASYMLMESSRKLFKENKSIGLVKAYIRSENKGSFNAFIKAGYKQDSKEIINEEEYEVLFLKR